MSKLGGFVTNHIDFKGHNPFGNETPDGLFSQVIFGPKNDYRCACGNYSNSTYDGQICPKCNVLCGSSDIRYKQFGKIKTVFPFIKPTKINTVVDKLGTLSKLIINPARSDYNKTITRYLAVSYDKTKLKIVKTLNDTSGFLIIPFRITGIYSLYISLKFCADYLKVPIAIEFLDKEYFTNILKVIPPNIRMYTIDKSQNKVWTPIINKWYTSVLNCNKVNLPFLSHLEDNENQTINKIRSTIKSRNFDQEIIEPEILEYDLKTYIYQYYINNIYETVYDLLSGKTGMIRRESLSKAVEFSARAVITIDPSLKAHQIRVSPEILEELWTPYFLYWLTKYKNFEYDYCFSNILIKDNRTENYNQLFKEFLDWFCDSSHELNRLTFLNRPPTLYAHSIPVVEILPSYNKNDYTIGLSPLTLAPMNADLDGDTLALFTISDIDALKEMHDKAYLKNKFKYDSNQQMLMTLRHETLYAIFILTSVEINHDKSILKIESLDDLPESFDYWNFELDKPIMFKDQIYSYGICLINKWAGLSDILINFQVSKKNSNDVSEIIYDYNPDKFHENIQNLSNTLFFFISSTIHCPSININEMIDIVDDSTQKLFHKLPTHNPYLGYYINEALIDKCIDNMNKSEDLYKLYKSGSRFNKSQLARICINTGYIADAENIVNYKPINSNLITGFNPSDFLNTSLGTRKGIVDKAKSTPNSGYIQRTLSMALSPLEIVEEDCGTDYHLEFIVFNQKHAKTLTGKYYKDPNNPSMEWSLLDFPTAKSYINKKIWIRSPMTCQTENFRICKKCFGNRKLNTPYIGIVAGQLISERLTQLVMRSFHTSGSCNLAINNDIKNFIKNHLIDIEFIDDKYILIFDQSPTISFADINGYDHIKDNKVFIDTVNEKVVNIDVISTLTHINELLNTKTKNISKTPTEYYEEFMSRILEVGTIFSSFVECVFANMFLTGKNPNIFWRYDQNNNIIFKAGRSNLAYIVNPRLSCLFQPNSTTLQYLNYKSDFKTFYEKVWDQTL